MLKGHKKFQTENSSFELEESGLGQGSPGTLILHHFQITSEKNNNHENKIKLPSPVTRNLPSPDELFIPSGSPHPKEAPQNIPVQPFLISFFPNKIDTAPVI